MASFKSMTEYREFPFYRKYRFRASIKARGFNYIHKATNMAEYERYSRYIEARRTSFSRLMHPYTEFDKLTANDLEVIARIIDFINDLDKKECLVRREGETISFFSNDLSLLEKLKGIKSVVLTEAIATGPGILPFKKKPPANYRLFLKSIRLSQEARDEFKEYLNANENLHLSSSLKSWLEKSYFYTSSSYYIDYNSSKEATMLGLKFPELIGKNYKLKQINE